MEENCVMKMSDIYISGTLGPRFISIGPNSGEEFRTKYLIPWFEQLEGTGTGIIDFSGITVYSPSFLEEGFAGAIRAGYKDEVKNLQFINMDPYWCEKLKGFILKAVREAK
ncbi:hypothetical protein SDC9_89969 [bioreactor metagenome]|uniref:DUF4325 domain-containing protein n=1 Tax=bioreactor metagenome TaxID=1076179 RepID=A0A644ZRA9_9ZZZZ